MKTQTCPIAIFLILLCTSTDLSFANDSLMLWQKPTHDIRCIEFTHDSKFIVTGGEDKNIFFWDVNTGEIVKQIYSPIGVNDIEFTSNDSLMAVGGTEAVDIWDVNNMIIVRSFKFWQTPINSTSFSPDNYHLAIAGNHYGLYIFSVMTGDTVLHLKEYPWHDYWGKDTLIHVVQYLNDSKKILISHGFGMTYDLVTKAFGKELKGQDGLLSPDNRYVIGWSGANTSDQIRYLYYSNVETGEIIKTINMGKNNFDYSFSPDGKYIITSQTYGTISYWRIDKDEPVYQYYYSIAPSSFGYLAVSHNGQYIASHSRGYLVIYSTKWSPTSVVEKSGNQLIITNFYPNPAKTELIVEFTLPLPGNIQISLTNEAGITTLASLLFLEPGAHKTILNIGNIAPGPYFLKLEQNGLSDVKKIIILR